MSKPWFGPTTHGYGLGPISLEGWLAVLVYILVVGATVPFIKLIGAPLWTTGLAVVVETAAMGAVMVAKYDGSPWRWRWDGKE